MLADFHFFLVILEESIPVQLLKNSPDLWFIDSNSQLGEEEGNRRPGKMLERFGGAMGR